LELILMSEPTTDTPEQHERKRRLAILARASRDRLEAAIDGLGSAPQVTRLRAPEVGMVMVQGRSGGTGGRFNLGEMTVARCTVQLIDASGVRRTGVGTVAGRDRRRAELVAVFDALCQCPEHAEALEGGLIQPLAAEQDAARAADAAKVSATTVDFFTLARESGA
jgi:alpha-D-ribose 1-methylphosphonate 5-triphosphate synthase subunit PhnG